MNITLVKGLCKDIIEFYDKQQDNQAIPTDMKESISNLRLKKILFFLYGYYWKADKKEIIDIDFEAWHYGPVINELYYFLIDNLGVNRYNPLELNWFKNFETPKYNKESFKKY